MNGYKILVADDEAKMRRLIKDFLETSGYSVVEAADGFEAVEVFDSENPDLVILDVMMPRLDGWDACSIIRKNSSVPVIMLTALTAEDDELKGFSIGADEYISKPFSPKILVARVDALLRRTLSQSQEILSEGGITVDEASHTVKIYDEIVPLTFKEFELLVFFMRNKGIALSRDKILNSVWNYDFFGDARTIDSHITKLRGKLGEKGKYIHTVRSIGYKFEVEE